MSKILQVSQILYQIWVNSDLVFMTDIIAINTQELNNASKPVQVNQDQPKLKSHNLNPLLQDKMHLEE